MAFDFSSINYEDNSKLNVNIKDGILIPFGSNKPVQEIPLESQTILLEQLLNNPAEPETFLSLFFIYTQCKHSDIHQLIIQLFNDIFMNFIKDFSRKSNLIRSKSQKSSLDPQTKVLSGSLNSNSNSKESSGVRPDSNIFIKGNLLQDSDASGKSFSLAKLQKGEINISPTIIKTLLEILPKFVRNSCPDEVRQLVITIPLIIQDVIPHCFSLLGSVMEAAGIIVGLYETKELQHQEALLFAQLVLDASFSLTKLFSSPNFQSKTRKEIANLTIGLFIPFAAHASELNLQIPEIFDLLHQFWVVITIVSRGNFELIFPNYRNELLKIASKLDPSIFIHGLDNHYNQSYAYGYSSLYRDFNKNLLLVQNVLQRIDIDCWKSFTIEEIGTIITSFAPSMPLKFITGMSLKEAIFFLSVMGLEKMRSTAGFFSPILYYLSSKSSPNFIQAINYLIEPLFLCYSKTVLKTCEFNSMLAFESKIFEIHKVAAFIFDSIGGKYISFQSLMERIGIPFLSQNPSSVLHFLPLKSFIQSISGIRSQISQLLQPIFICAIQISPMKFTSALLKALYDLFISKDYDQQLYEFPQPSFSLFGSSNLNSIKYITSIHPMLSHTIPYHLLYHYFPERYLDTFLKLYLQFISNVPLRNQPTSDYNNQILRTIINITVATDESKKFMEYYGIKDSRYFFETPSLLKDNSKSNSNAKQVLLSLPNSEFNSNPIYSKIEINESSHRRFSQIPFDPLLKRNYTIFDPSSLFIEADLDYKLQCWDFVTMLSKEHFFSFIQALILKINELT